MLQAYHWPQDADTADLLKASLSIELSVLTVFLPPDVLLNISGVGGALFVVGVLIVITSTGDANIAVPDLKGVSVVILITRSDVTYVGFCGILLLTDIMSVESESANTGASVDICCGEVAELDNAA